MNKKVLSSDSLTEKFDNMSMNRMAIVAAIGTHNAMKNRSDDIRFNKHPSIEAHERPNGNGNSFNGDVNVLLGGAMFSLMVSIVCFLCYCCHRSLKRRDVIYRQRWVHVDPNMDIYSVEQYYDISANNTIDDDQYTQIMRNHGPPPSYEIAVAMKSPMTPENCYLCQNKIRLQCACDPQSSKDDEDDSDKMDSSMKQPSDQLLNVKNISLHQQAHGCNQRNERETCEICDQELPGKNENLCEDDMANGNCEGSVLQSTNSCQFVQNCGVCGKDIHIVPQTRNSPDINDNVPSTSGDANVCQNCDINCNQEESDGEEDAEFDSLNENGLIRVDMRKIIDQTGLPTYEAALKLESSGYV